VVEALASKLVGGLPGGGHVGQGGDHIVGSKAVLGVGGGGGTLIHILPVPGATGPITECALSASPPSGGGWEPDDGDAVRVHSTTGIRPDSMRLGRSRRSPQIGQVLPRLSRLLHVHCRDFVGAQAGKTNT